MGINGEFFVPRVLQQNHRLTLALCSLWFRPHSLKYGLLQRFYWNARNHYHPDLAESRIASPFWKRIYLELWLLRRVKRQTLEMAYLANSWYQREVAKYLESRHCRDLWNGPPGVFLSWSYIAKDIIPIFQRRGWKCIVMQLDGAAHEERIVKAEVDAYPDLAPDWRPAPVGYFADWEIESRRADRLIANSHWGKECLESCGVPAEKISVIPFATESRIAASPRNYPATFDNARPLRVLYVGQMVLRKGLARLFGAIRLLADAPIRFDFAGASGMTIPADIARSPNVNVLGRVSREKVEQLYRDADLFILPTLSDAFGLTQLEAMARRLPLITTRHAGEVVEDGINGVVLREVSAERIASTLLELAKSPAALAEMSRKCRVPDQCSLEHFGERLLKIESNWPA
jgi:glycosyltransferase involved in cell wall biosynthesis